MFIWITFATTEVPIACVSSTLLQVLFVLAVMLLITRDFPLPFVR